MNIAICISGTTKNHYNSIKSIEKLKHYNPDIFIHTYDNNSIKEIIEDSWSKETAKIYYNNLTETTKQIISHYDHKSCIVEDYNKAKENFQEIYDRISPHINMLNAASKLGPISMHYSIMQANQQKYHYERLTKKTYDLTIRMRFDSDILEIQPLENYDITKINIPKKRDWGGINDQFAFGPSHLMDIYSALYPSFTYFALFSKIYHPETIFEKFLESCNVLRNITRPDKLLVGISSDVDYSTQI